MKYIVIIALSCLLVQCTYSTTSVSKRDTEASTSSAEFLLQAVAFQSVSMIIRNAIFFCVARLLLFNKLLMRNSL